VTAAQQGSKRDTEAGPGTHKRIRPSPVSIAQMSCRCSQCWFPPLLLVDQKLFPCGPCFRTAHAFAQPHAGV
jgi:hypothetical protein